MPATKIATCCYCGTRAALVLRGDTRHELSCAACGAPLHNLKAIPVDREPRSKTTPVPHAARHPAPQARPPKPRKRRRKSLSRRILSEAIDLLDDIFD